MRRITGERNLAPVLADYRGCLPRPDRTMGGRRGLAQSSGIRREGVVSVITVTFNSIQTVNRTIDAVSAQTYPLVEYIVIDGGSSDGTVDSLRRRESEIDIWISEYDDGISDAFNRGIALSSGEFIMLVNSDDWIESTHLIRAVQALRENEVDFVFGNVMLHRTDGSEAGLLIGDANFERSIEHLMPALNHPSAVCLAQAYERHGLYDLKLHNAMDYEWFLRVYKAGGRGAYVPDLTSHMTLEGRSDAQFNASLAEVRTISIRYGYSVTLAWTRFSFRVIKGAIRRFLSRVLPVRIYEEIRTKANSNFRRPVRR